MTKHQLSYVCDSSEGEAQFEREKSYKANAASYITYVNKGLSAITAPFQASYIFKEIGGGLLHSKQVSRKYIQIKKNYDISAKNKEFKNTIIESFHEKIEGQIIKDKHFLDV